MEYGHFDNEKREYVIHRVDLPVSWTNYLGVRDMCAVLNHTAGGYLFYQSPQYHRITRFRPNGVPMDRPGHYVYLRDDDGGDYWSISWQPVGKDLQKGSYTCRHGLSYTVYECLWDHIKASQKMSVAMEDPVEIWDVTIKNEDDRPRRLSVFSYAEFSFHHIDMDNQNFQMSLYCSGSSYREGILEYDLFYEEFGYQFFTASFQPDGYDCRRDDFLGPYRTETNPLGVERGCLSGSSELGGNHCGALHKRLLLMPGEEVRLFFLLGEGDRREGARMRKKYACQEGAEEAYRQLAAFWEERLGGLQVKTPEEGMNTMLNIWNLYQAEINLLFSRFASFIEVGGRTGLGFRDTAQDAMTIPHAEPVMSKKRLSELLCGTVKEGYGLHLFSPEWFQPDKEEKKPFASPTVVPTPDPSQRIHGLKDTCSDDALWLVSAVCEYVRETGEISFLRELYPYADGGRETVYQHLKRILDFSDRQVGEDGICKGLRADWNDCLNLGGGQSAMVSFLHFWAIENFLELARELGEEKDAAFYGAMKEKVKRACQGLWDQDWYIRGITKSGRRIGTKEDEEGKIHLESNVWAVLSGAAPREKGIRAMDSVYEHLFTPYGLMLNGPAYTRPDEEIGFVTRVYPGLKENASIFSHPNPWAWAAECVLGRGNRAMELYKSLCPWEQNDKIQIRKAEPYSYCQFVAGKDHGAYGRAHHPFMTGTGGWAYFSASRYILGIRPGLHSLVIDPCIPREWDGFSAVRRWRGGTYHIQAENPEHVSKGVKECFLDGRRVLEIPPIKEGESCNVRIVMGGL
ncbi:MAG: N,N'-diacetylchitobiose phosphorylase [Eubacteriales bacterium]|nr:N,N'-diacetylchitobiose phosphorylase [Eubacteriales bacterium]